MPIHSIPGVEVLEPRRFLTGVTVKLSDHILLVQGNPHHFARITIDRVENNIRVIVKDQYTKKSAPRFGVDVVRRIKIIGAAKPEMVTLFLGGLGSNKGDNDYFVEARLGGGNDRLEVKQSSPDAPMLCRGGSGDDTILGGDTNDLIFGDSGDDSIDGGAGNDSLFGGADNDIISGSDGNDTVAGESGSDILRGGYREQSTRKHHKLREIDAEKDKLLGSGGPDTLIGNAGDGFDPGSGENVVLNV